MCIHGECFPAVRSVSVELAMPNAPGGDSSNQTQEEKGRDWGLRVVPLTGEKHGEEGSFRAQARTSHAARLRLQERNALGLISGISNACRTRNRPEHGDEEGTRRQTGSRKLDAEALRFFRTRRRSRSQPGLMEAKIPFCLPSYLVVLFFGSEGCHPGLRETRASPQRARELVFTPRKNSLTRRPPRWHAEHFGRR